jgi:hypothetical protein
MVFDPTTKDPTVDTPSAYDLSLEAKFYYSSMSERTWAHELGHMMGLGDDYRDSFNGSYPIKGREKTLMDTGDAIDEALANRLLDMARKSGAALPTCWTGKLHMGVRDVTPSVTCVGNWDADVRLAVSKDGDVAGKATVTKAPPNSCGPGTFAIVGQSYPLTGKLTKKKMRLNLSELKASLTRSGNSAQGPMTAQVPVADSTAYYDGTVAVSCGRC